MVTLLDLHARYRLAMTVRRQSVELAGAAVGAVAVDELTSVNRPVRVDHLRLPPLGESAGSLLNSHDQFLSAAENRLYGSQEEAPFGGTRRGFFGSFGGTRDGGGTITRWAV